MKSNSQKTQLTLAIIFFLVSFSGFLFLYTNVRTRETLSEQKLSEWRVETARRDEIKSLDSAIKKIEKEKSMLDTHFVNIANPVAFLDALETLARSVSTEIKVSSVVVVQDGSSLVVDMDTSGGFEDFYKFLTLLENSDYDMEFISIDVKKEGELGGKWSSTLRIRLLTFIQ